ncbi:hypothetical protein [Metabacillus fastidiosus]|uniref:Uncharacterized protein n=1 Tax=Metabacillus fastidiosus TaxID=1458 RepID=A0ABU6NRL2_9BACI|nr:hypothetical protein [Metabacillus fastidiosus]
MDFISFITNEVSGMEKERQELSERVQQGLEESRQRMKEKSEQFEDRRKERETF